MKFFISAIFEIKYKNELFTVEFKPHGTEKTQYEITVCFAPFHEIYNGIHTIHTISPTNAKHYIELALSKLNT